MSTALILSGGGAKGIGHVYALWQIHNRTDWLSDLELVAGTSAGALVGAMIAQGGSDAKKRETALNRLTGVWDRVSFDDVYGRGVHDFLWAAVRHHAFGWGKEPLGIRTTGPLRSILDEHLPGPSHFNATFWPVRYNLSEQTVEYQQPASREEMIEMTRASASTPIYAEPVRYEGKVYVDGGVRDITPLRLLVEYASNIDRAIVINLQSIDVGTKPEGVESLEGLVSQVLGVVTRDIFVNDVGSYKRLNAMGKGGIEDPLDGEVPVYIPTIWIEPDENLPSWTDFSSEAKERTKGVMRRAADRVIEGE
jgi:NTE family protein